MSGVAQSTADRFTTRELIEEATREASIRRHLFGKQVRAGRMDQREADRRIDLMEAIARRLSRTAHF
ncbi:hypothetical protein [Pararhodobacter sp.]|uniref:hypothetical protein n=1 Tax=Pararhodobacter sp. TaxID=2127056 RepID=UPI002FDCF68C